MEDPKFPPDYEPGEMEDEDESDGADPEGEE